MSRSDVRLGAPWWRLPLLGMLLFSVPSACTQELPPVQKTLLILESERPVDLAPPITHVSILGRIAGSNDDVQIYDPYNDHSGRLEVSGIDALYGTPFHIEIGDFVGDVGGEEDVEIVARALAEDGGAVTGASTVIGAADRGAIWLRLTIDDLGELPSAPCVPVPEACDGLDNDCDGETDEGLDEVIADGPCDDNIPCTTDFCYEGSCIHKGDDHASCQDKTLCTTDTCEDNFGCQNLIDAELCPGCLVAADCVNTNPCVEMDCVACQGTACPEGFDRRCEPKFLDGKNCSDGNPCTLEDYCEAGSCRQGTTKPCTDGLECTIDFCDDATGACAYEGAEISDACDDGRDCTLDSCIPGQGCFSDIGSCSCSVDADCFDDGNPCTTELCNTNGTCVTANKAQGTPCEVQAPHSCVESYACNGKDGCEPTTFIEAGAPCDDLDICTADDVCDAEGACVGGEPIEICNAKDDDCDDKVDEGIAGANTSCDSEDDPDLCANGIMKCDETEQLVCAGDVPPKGVDAEGAELLCNGEDEDCDGLVDEDFAVGIMCEPETPDGGAETCYVTVCDPNKPGGALLCIPKEEALGGKGGAASEPAVKEICNGIDDDCDGEVDNGVGGPEIGVECGSPGSPCAGGKTLCKNGAIHCSTDGMAKLEECDGVDNDCDGAIDETFPVGASCDGNDADECEDGEFVCQFGGVTCSDDDGAVTEVCDGLDNDCDGLSDEDEESVCPPTANVHKSLCGQPGEVGDYACIIAICKEGYVDTNGLWEDGCEDEEASSGADTEPDAGGGDAGGGDAGDGDADDGDAIAGDGGADIGPDPPVCELTLSDPVTATLKVLSSVPTLSGVAVGTDAGVLLLQADGPEWMLEPSGFLSTVGPVSTLAYDETNGLAVGQGELVGLVKPWLLEWNFPGEMQAVSWMALDGAQVVDMEFLEIESSPRLAVATTEGVRLYSVDQLTGGLTLLASELIAGISDISSTQFGLTGDANPTLGVLQPLAKQVRVLKTPSLASALPSGIQFWGADGLETPSAITGVSYQGAAYLVATADADLFMIRENYMAPGTGMEILVVDSPPVITSASHLDFAGNVDFDENSWGGPLIVGTETGQVAAGSLVMKYPVGGGGGMGEQPEVTWSFTPASAPSIESITGLELGSSMPAMSSTHFTVSGQSSVGQWELNNLPEVPSVSAGALWNLEGQAFTDVVVESDGGHAWLAHDLGIVRASLELPGELLVESISPLFSATVGLAHDSASQRLAVLDMNAAVVVFDTTSPLPKFAGAGTLAGEIFEATHITSLGLGRYIISSFDSGIYGIEVAEQGTIQDVEIWGTYNAVGAQARATALITGELWIAMGTGGIHRCAFDAVDLSFPATCDVYSLGEAGFAYDLAVYDSENVVVFVALGPAGVGRLTAPPTGEGWEGATFDTLSESGLEFVETVSFDPVSGTLWAGGMTGKVVAIDGLGDFQQPLASVEGSGSVASVAAVPNGGAVVARNTGSAERLTLTCE